MVHFLLEEKRLAKVATAPLLPRPMGRKAAQHHGEAIVRHPIVLKE